MKGSIIFLLFIFIIISFAFNIEPTLAVTAESKLKADQLWDECIALSKQNRLKEALAKCKESLNYWASDKRRQAVAKLEAEIKRQTQNKADTTQNKIIADRLWDECIALSKLNRLNEALTKCEESLNYWSNEKRKKAVAQFRSKIDIQKPQSHRTVNIFRLAETFHGGYASLVYAAMRELAGPLSSHDSAKLDAEWAPYLLMPTKKTEEYFKNLAPIMQEVLILRTEAATAAAEFDSAWQEAVIAASYDSEEGVREALAVADQQRAILMSIQKRMEELSEKAKKLGSPPNPIEHKENAKKEWEGMVESFLSEEEIFERIKRSIAYAVVSGASKMMCEMKCLPNEIECLEKCRRQKAQEENDVKVKKEEKDKIESAITFHQANIRIIRANLEKDRQELAEETDPNRRAQLEWRILQGESNLMHEEDLLRSLQTGKIVHRRTPFDNYAHDRFVQSIRENQVEMERFQRATTALQRLAGMLPPGEAEEARNFIARQLTDKVLEKRDMQTVQRIAQALSKKVQGYYEKERAQAQLDEATASYALETAQSFKSVADKGMFAASIFGGRGVMLAYQAATGYVEGGPQEAILRTAAWISTPAYVASEAFRGYHRTDEEGRPLGWRGAAADAAKAYILSKIYDYGVSKARQWASGLSLTGSIQGRKPQVSEGMTVAERIQLEQFQRLRREGERKVQEFARLQAELERVGRAGASPEIIKELQNKVTRTAALINADPHAKNYLKYKGDPHIQRAYNAHMRANYAVVEARFHEIMEQKGWNRQPLREFRNSASGDSVGMDHDIGLDEYAITSLRRHGKPATLYEWQQDAQKAWDEAYQYVTGQSAARSWETVTTSIHAEAYKDLNWLSQDKSAIQRVWAQQAADVTRYKNWHLLNDPSLNYFTRLQEVSRGTAKDIKTKVQPLLNSVKPEGQESAIALAKARSKWEEIYKVLDAFGRNDIDPITASRRIRELTGKDIPQVVDDAAMLIESLGKRMGK